jgi:hypothetical protein
MPRYTTRGRIWRSSGQSGAKTSVFPDSKSGRYLLPVKAHVRASEELQSGDMVSLVISDDVDYPISAHGRGTAR